MKGVLEILNNNEIECKSGLLLLLLLILRIAIERKSTDYFDLFWFWNHWYKINYKNDFLRLKITAISPNRQPSVTLLV